MAQLLKTHKGVDYFKINMEEVLIKLNGFGICDSCCENIKEQGFLIPVLNSVYCTECFEKFEKTAKAYKEDEEYAKNKIKYFSNFLTIEN